MMDMMLVDHWEASLEFLLVARMVSILAVWLDEKLAALMAEHSDGLMDGH